MKRYIALVIVALLVVTAGTMAGRYGWAVSTTDYYYGTVTQPPKINPYGEREVGLLSPGETVATTLNLEDFCMMPMTSYCRFNTADLHNTFSEGKPYCVIAYGWRLGIMSWKPNIVSIVPSSSPGYKHCVAVGAPSNQQEQMK